MSRDVEMGATRALRAFALAIHGKRPSVFQVLSDSDCPSQSDANSNDKSIWTH